MGQLNDPGTKPYFKHGQEIYGIRCIRMDP